MITQSSDHVVETGGAETLTLTPAAREHSATEPERREATVMELAGIVAESRSVPDCVRPAVAAVRILAGREMGVGPIASVLGIRIQAGRVSMDASLIAGLIDRSEKYDYQVKEHTNDRCEIEFTKIQPDGAPCRTVGVSVFSLDDAKKAGLAGKDTWKAYPRNMLFARALANGARWYCPGIFGGSVYTHEELGYAVDEDGRAVAGDDGDATPVGGGGLCSRQQRERITYLLLELKKPVSKLLEEMGVKLLDQLGEYEAAKLIKKLEKQAAKKSPGETAAEPAATTTPGPEVEPKDAQAPASETATGTPAQQMMQEAFDTIKPSTRSQRADILHLAEQLEPDEDARHEMLVAILAKRGVAKIGELSAAQAHELIEAMRVRLRQPTSDH